MAHETSLSERSLINHLPAAGPDWAWRHLQGDRTKTEPWRFEAETRQRLAGLTKRYRRVPATHPFWDRLQNVDAPPIELWFAGELPPPPYLVVVGPRQPSEAARQLTISVVGRLAPYVTIVSGLARGIDSIALATALESGGRVAAFVPTGLDEELATAGPLIRRILNNGALVAERLFISHLSKSHFLFRNRLLAGVADAVYVPEAGERSGTFNTITHALKMGVDVLVSPGEVGRPTAAGSNRLIREGAPVVLEADDIATALGIALSAETKTPLERAVARGGGTVEEIAARLGWNVPRTIRELAAAQSHGLVEQDWLGRYRLLAGGRKM
jgi:DNA processing protein